MMAAAGPREGDFEHELSTWDRKVTYRPSTVLRDEDLIIPPLPLATAFPSRIWNDTMLDDIVVCGRPNLSNAQLIALGENLLLMVYYRGRSPVYYIAKIVTVLALHLKTEKGEDMFDEGNVRESVMNEQLHSIGDENFIASCDDVTGRVTEGTQERRGQEVPQQRANRLGAFRRVLGGGNDPRGGATEELLNTLLTLRDLHPKFQVRFYCFFAAVLCRACVKSRETLQRQLKTFPERFFCFYDPPPSSLPDVQLPEANLDALELLKNTFRPGSVLVRTVMKAFLTKRYLNESTLSADTKGILSYTLLTQTSFNGMQLVSLTKTTASILGMEISRLKYELISDATVSGWKAVMDYFQTYEVGAPNAPGLYAPWSRVINPEMWSILHARKHQTMAAILMAFCQGKDPDIFDMPSVRIPNELKERVIKLVDNYNKSEVQTRYSRKK